MEIYYKQLLIKLLKITAIDEGFSIKNISSIAIEETKLTQQEIDYLIELDK